MISLPFFFHFSKQNVCIINQSPCIKYDLNKPIEKPSLTTNKTITIKQTIGFILSNTILNY